MFPAVCKNGALNPLMSCSGIKESLTIDSFMILISSSQCVLSGDFQYSLSVLCLQNN